MRPQTLPQNYTEHELKCPGVDICIGATAVGGHAVAQWLRRYATNRKVAGSRPDEANDFY
jgi:hypothetical protein